MKILSVGKEGRAPRYGLHVCAHCSSAFEFEKGDPWRLFGADTFCDCPVCGGNVWLNKLLETAHESATCGLPDAVKNLAAFSGGQNEPKQQPPPLGGNKER